MKVEFDLDHNALKYMSENELQLLRALFADKIYSIDNIIEERKKGFSFKEDSFTHSRK